MAALLPNLASVRRPSKSAIVNSSIALIRTQRRLRAIAAQELRQLAAEADALRREVNEWRSAHPTSPVPSARMNGGTSALELIAEPVRSAEFLALIELEDVPEDSMNEQERIAYEMRGGDSGPLAASSLTGEDGEDEFGVGGEDDLCDNQRFVVGHPPMQPQPQQLLPTTPGVPSIVHGNARARAQSLTIPRHLQQQQQQMQHQFAAHHQQQQQHQAVSHLAQFQHEQQLQINTQQAQAAAASLIPSPYGQSSLEQQQQQYDALQQQQHRLQQQAMQMNPAGFPHMTFIPPSFDAIAAAAANGFSNSPTAAQPQTPAPVPSMTNEQDTAKVTAWNAHLFSTAITTQQQQRDQQQQQPQRQFGVQFQTPPPSSDGPNGPFGGGNHTTPQQQQNQLFRQFQRVQSDDMTNSMTADDSMDAAGVSTPSSHASSAAPSLSLSLSSLTSASPASGGAPSSAGGSAHPSSLSASIASPLHNLSLSNAQPDAFNVFAYGGAGANWGNVGGVSVSGKSPVTTPVVQTPAITVGGGGGGGGGFHQYPMMGMFI